MAPGGRRTAICYPCTADGNRHCDRKWRVPCTQCVLKNQAGKNVQCDPTSITIEQCRAKAAAHRAKMAAARSFPVQPEARQRGQPEPATIAQIAQHEPATQTTPLDIGIGNQQPDQGMHQFSARQDSTAAVVKSPQATTSEVDGEYGETQEHQQPPPQPPNTHQGQQFDELSSRMEVLQEAMAQNAIERVAPTQSLKNRGKSATASLPTPQSSQVSQTTNSVFDCSLPLTSTRAVQATRDHLFNSSHAFAHQPTFNLPQAHMSAVHVNPYLQYGLGYMARRQLALGPSLRHDQASEPPDNTITSQVKIDPFLGSGYKPTGQSSLHQALSQTPANGTGPSALFASGTTLQNPIDLTSHAEAESTNKSKVLKRKA